MTTDIQADAAPHPGPGRPRSFDMDAAIEAGVALLRRDGFEAASLDALTRAMGISRSSFYAAFGSKRGVLMTALDRYSRQRQATLRAIAAGPVPLAAMLRAIAGLESDAHGCLLVNCISELAPRDAEIAAVARSHIRGIEMLVAGCLPAGRDSSAAAEALVALALGVQTLRKSGADPARLATLIDLALERLAPA